MLLPLVALFGLLGLMAGLAMYLIKQQKQADGGAAGKPEAAAAPRVSGDQGGGIISLSGNCSCISVWWHSCTPNS
jgi:hypothetical protein